MFGNFKTIKKYKSKFLLFRKNGAGITLVEIVVVLFVVSLFSVIIVANFPRIMRQSALSRATYKLAQDLRSAQDLGLSGVIINDANGDVINNVEGYGIYVGTPPTNQYVIYADVASGGANVQKYSGDAFTLCSDVEQSGIALTSDCVIEIIDVTDENPSLSISGIVNNFNGTDINSGTSINFTPPNPTINIEDDDSNHYFGSGIKIVLQNTDGSTRAVLINGSGLIDVQ